MQPRRSARLVWWAGLGVLVVGWLIQVYPVMGIGTFMFGYGCGWSR